MCAHRLEQRGDVARGNRIARLRLPVLARVAEIRHDRRHGRGGCVAQRADEEQQAAQLVIDARVVIAVEGLQHEHIALPDVHERTRLVLAVLELPLLVSRQRPAEMPGHPLAVVAG